MIKLKGCLPEHGFSEIEIEAIINKLSLMDSNNWCHSAGVGEREGRILLDLVRRRHFGYPSFYFLPYFKLQCVPFHAL